MFVPESVKKSERGMQIVGSGPSLTCFPDETLLHIFRHVPRDQSLVNAKFTCKRFQRLVDDIDISWNHSLLALHGPLNINLLEETFTKSATIHILDLADCNQVSDQLMYHFSHRVANVIKTRLSKRLCSGHQQEYVYSKRLRQYTGQSLSLRWSLHNMLWSHRGSLLKNHYRSMRYLDISNCRGLLQDRYHIRDIAEWSRNLTELNVEWSPGYNMALLLDSELSHTANNRAKVTGSKHF